MSTELLQFAKTEVSSSIVLASFPKAGNTWVRFMIANVYNELNHRVDEVDFHNIHEIIPDLGQCPIKAPLFEELPNIYKTHEEFKNRDQKVILVLRNPFDTLYSYFKYLTEEKKFDITMENMVRDDTFGIRPLVKHTETYIRNCNDMLILTYEKIYDDAARELSKICKFIGVNVDDQILFRAVNKSSFVSMRQIERIKGRKYAASEFMFTRSGQCGEGVREIKKYSGVYDLMLQEIEKSPFLHLIYM